MSQPEYTDRVACMTAPWPLVANGWQIVSIDAVQRIMQDCDIIARAGAFAMYHLQQWHACPRLRLPPPLHAVIPDAAAANMLIKRGADSDAAACVPALRIRIRCSQVAFVAARLASHAMRLPLALPTDARCRLAQAIARRVFCGLRRRAEVRRSPAHAARGGL
jgi:hypothetical protein